MALMTPTKPRQMTDRLIALQMLGMAKVAAQALSAAGLEANNPDLKRLYHDYGHETESGVDALQTYIVDQQWAKPFVSPDEQLQLARENADALISVNA